MATHRAKSFSAEPCKQAVSILADPARDNPASLEEAISLLKLTIQEDPRDHRAYFAKGVALEKLDRLEEAAAAYNAALQINGKDPSDKKYPRLYSAAIVRVKGRMENRELVASAESQRANPAMGAESVGQP